MVSHAVGAADPVAAAEQLSIPTLALFAPEQQFDGCKPKAMTLPWLVPSPILQQPEQKQAIGHLTSSF